MQVKRLEERLQAELFHRSTTNVDLSAAGEGLIGYARRILSLNEEAVGRVRAHGMDGRVRLGVMDDYGTLIVPPLLASFVANYPLVHVEMETGLTSTMTDRLGEAYDLVIAMHPEGRGEGELLRTEQAVWAASVERRVEQIDPLPVALYPQGCLFRSWAMQALDAAKRQWRLAFVSHSLSAVEAIAAQGLAVTVVKSGTFPPTLRRLTARDGMPRLPRAEIRLHRAQNLSRAASLLADHVVTALRQPGMRAR
jgi:DNA-binding transcriptional LysR family regulator